MLHSYSLALNLSHMYQPNGNRKFYKWYSQVFCVPYFLGIGAAGNSCIVIVITRCFNKLFPQISIYFHKKNVKQTPLLLSFNPISQNEINVWQDLSFFYRTLLPFPTWTLGNRCLFPSILDVNPLFMYNWLCKTNLDQTFISIPSITIPSTESLDLIGEPCWTV